MGVRTLTEYDLSPFKTVLPNGNRQTTHRHTYRHTHRHTQTDRKARPIATLGRTRMANKDVLCTAPY